RQKIDWAGPTDAGAVAELTRLAQSYQLHGYLLVPAADADVQFVSENKKLLSEHFSIVLPSWEDLKTLVEKPLLYRRALELGVSVPTTYQINSIEQSQHAEIQFPVILKPDMGGGNDAFSKAKVVRADDRE